MQNKQIKHSYGGMNQDITKSQFPNNYYFQGNNIRINATTDQGTSSVMNEKGNSLIITIPTLTINKSNPNSKKILYSNKELIYKTTEIDNLVVGGEQIIIGHSNSREYIILFTTNDNGLDCIWKLTYDTYDLTLLYLRDMDFSKNNPIQTINNFENKNIDKVYWVDSKSQMRFINIYHSIENKDTEELIDVSVSVIDMVGKYDLNQPVVSNVVSGGNHTAGMIQYAYNLYKLNSSQTKISPLTDLVSLDKGNQGGNLNELVGALPIIDINNIDPNYTNIRVYAIKYTSYNEIPSISLIEDRLIPTNKSIQVFDDGSVINTLSLDEFIFLGSDIIIPKHINSKDNRLFLANYQEINFDVDLDTRAYSFPANTTSTLIYEDLKLESVPMLGPDSYGIYEWSVFGTEDTMFSISYIDCNNVSQSINDYIGNINSGSFCAKIGTPSSEKAIIVMTGFSGTPTYNTTTIEQITGTSLPVYADYNVPPDHDSVNLNYDTRRYQYNSSIEGGEGKYLKYELTKSSVFNEDNKYFKDDEIYRLGIVFYNKYGQKSPPKWVSDFKASDGNLNGHYNTLKVTLKPTFFTWLNDTSFLTEYDKPVGYKILVAERTINDRTIVANGLLSPMMINYKTSNQHADSILNTTKSIADTLPKLPNILSRNYNKTSLYGIAKPLRKSLHLDIMSVRRNDSDNEMPRGDREDKDTAGRHYQFNSMMQLYSPEILFNNSISLSESTQLRIKGSLKNNTNNAWGRVYESSLTAPINDEIRVTGGLMSHYLEPSGSFENIINGQTSPWARGLVTSVFTNDYSKAGFVMYDRIYGGNEPSDINTGLYQKSPNSIKYDIYGKPELVEKGQSGTNYNNDPKYRYLNSLESVLTDSGRSNYDDDDSNFRGKIVSINSYGNKCINLVLGNSSTTEHWNRKTHELLGLEAGITGDNNGLIGELVKTDSEIYLGNIYGGNTYEDKKRTNYIEIGNYSKLNSLIPSISIESPGDTFVNFFKFARIVRTDKDIITEGTFVLEELITILSETTVDLKNRNDLSVNDWKSRFQPLDAEYHKYNRVYSQMSNLVQNRDINYNIKKLNSFDTNIISSKLKSSGELIDSWTDILQNEVLTLDGKHGSINSLTNFNDQIYGIQDKAFAYISINPRVQIQGDDGISVELGSGSVLQEYKYISTQSGTINKWSVIPAATGIYYYDLLNKAYMVFNGQISSISDTKMMHSYFISNTELEGLKTDNPLIKQGISSGYDQINNDVFMTFHRTNGKTPFTISFNESRNQFVSFYDYLPSMYISKGQYFITTHPDLKSIYRQYAGNYNNFYGDNCPSYITLNVNPEADLDTVFDNIMYKSEVYLNDVDQPDKTLTGIRLYSEYQDSGKIPIPLIVGRNSNLRRKFRDWNAILPRNQGSRERIRNPWVKLVLQFDNTSNYKLILHDISISYSV